MRHLGWLLLTLPAGCWIVAGTGDFTDAPPSSSGIPSGGSAGMGNGGSGASGGGGSGTGGEAVPCATDPCMSYAGADCADACLALYECGLVVCRGAGQPLCPGFGEDRSQISQQEFVQTCTADCGMDPVQAMVDTCQCDATIAALTGTSAEFAAMCDSGCDPGSCTDPSAPDCSFGMCTCNTANGPCGPNETCSPSGCVCGNDTAGSTDGPACSGPYPTCNGAACVCTQGSCTDGFVCKQSGMCGCDQDTDCYAIPNDPVGCDVASGTCTCLTGTCLGTDKKCDPNGGGAACVCISGLMADMDGSCHP
jgi:hypothetical protein